jgi:excisionase family DNA binding protein
MSTTTDVRGSFDRMLTVNEVAHLLHVHPTTVRRWEKRGELRAYRLGSKGTIRFKKEDVQGFVDDTARKATQNT